MVGILLELLVSWLVIWLAERKDLTVLGLKPTKPRLQAFILGIVIAAVLAAFYFLAIGFFSGGTWTFNEQFSFESFLRSSWWAMKSVLFEELIFRGVLLYIAIRKLGINVACIVSAVAFAIYHWFSHNALGNAAQMAIIFVTTGMAGLMFAFAFSVTRSLYFPIALHFGYNFTSIVIFSNGPLGEQLLTLLNADQVSGKSSTGLWLYQHLALPLVVLWYLKRIQAK